MHFPAAAQLLPVETRLSVVVAVIVRVVEAIVP
jgi:hypothetical protein